MFLSTHFGLGVLFLSFVLCVLFNFPEGILLSSVCLPIPRIVLSFAFHFLHRLWSQPKNTENGILPVQRLHREALSEHGDAFQLGARATMRPYGSTIEDAVGYFKTVNFPIPGKATSLDRGGYPPAAGGDKAFTPAGLREVEKETQAWLQFETEQYILDESLQAQVLKLAQKQGRNKACGFVGPFDAILRAPTGAEEAQKINAGISSLFQAAAEAGVHMGRVVGSGSMTGTNGSSAFIYIHTPHRTTVGTHLLLSHGS